MLTQNARRRKFARRPNTKPRKARELSRQSIRALEFDHARPASSQQILWDSVVRGFGVRVYASGRKVYVVRYKWPRGRDGKQRIFKIGNCAPIGHRPDTPPEAAELGDSQTYLVLEEARHVAIGLLNEAARGDLRGSDPVARIVAERRAAAEDRAAAVFTLRDLVELEWLPHASPRSREVYASRMRKHVLPLLGDKAAEAVTRGDVLKLRDAIVDSGSAPRSANLVMQALGTCFAWALDRELVAANPCAGLRALKVAENRYRPLTSEELRRAWAAAGKLEDVYLGKLFRMSILLGTRTRELTTAKWSDLDADGVLGLTATKSGRITLKPLSSAARALLESIPRLDGNPYVFPSPRIPGAHVSTAQVQQTWRKLCRAEGIPDDAHLHGLRSTLGDGLRDAGVPIAHISSALSHADTKVTERAYARANVTQAASALEAHAEAVLAAVGEESEP